ncbi:hypothetical protein D3C85_1858340 [compost metagenome]
MRACPGNGDLTRTGTDFLCDGNYGIEDLPTLRRILGLEHPTAKTFSATFLPMAVFSGQHAAAQRRPGHDTDA